jgi:hypothetical protein
MPAPAAQGNEQWNERNPGERGMAESGKAEREQDARDQR